MAIRGGGRRPLTDGRRSCPTNLVGRTTARTTTAGAGAVEGAAGAGPPPGTAVGADPSPAAAEPAGVPFPRSLPVADDAASALGGCPGTARTEEATRGGRRPYAVHRGGPDAGLGVQDHPQPPRPVRPPGLPG